MSSTINASNGAVSGLISTGDASGQLQLQVNNGTPAITLNTSGAVGVGSTPSYGTSGQVLTSSGSGTSPSWTTISTSPTIVRSARTSNTILGASDVSKLIAITSGTFTQTFDAASTLGSGWFCYIQNSGSGDITLDPNGSETIDGLTSYVMYPGEARLVQCDGTSLYTIVLNSFYKTFTTTSSFIRPPGYSLFSGFMWGGGGGGGKYSPGAGYYSAGGGGGACVPFSLPYSSFSGTQTVTIGSGGTGPATDIAGTAGGTSSIGTLIYSYGGGGGGTSDGANSGNGGGGGGLSGAGYTGSTTSGGNGGAPAINTPENNQVYAGGVGFGGGSGQTNASNTARRGFWGGGGGGAVNSAPGGNSIYGGGGGGGTTGSAATAGTSTYGGSGGNGSTSSSGTDGTIPGGGGGATLSGAKAGNGARGELRIWGVI